jgi:transposase
MKKVEDYEVIRRAYFIEQLSIRAIRRKMGYDRDTIRKAIVQSAPQSYQLKQPREAPVLGPFKEKINQLLNESDKQRRKQRYTAHRIYELVVEQVGYAGSEGAVHNYVSSERKKRKGKKDSYLPLEFDPGMDAQVDWMEAEVILGGVRQIVQFFILHLNYSKVRFVMAFPFQKQEAFFEAHIGAFHFIGGIPRRLTYDNLKTAVYQILEGHNRREQESFKRFRSHYLFESFYCNPAQGHEKGGVENDVGYIQRNFLTPLLEVASYAELNVLLLEKCTKNVQRKVRGKEEPVAQLWEEEKPIFLPLPEVDFHACSSHLAHPNAYSQVEFETNRYSVPVERRNDALILEAYPFHLRILSESGVVCEHPRCFGREQDVIDPLHYLPLLEERPGAFEHAIPVRRWRKEWPPEYEQLLSDLRQRWPEGRGVREFIAVLKLHREYPRDLVEQAVQSAVRLGASHLDGVRLCLRQDLEQHPLLPPIDLNNHPKLATVGNQPLDLGQYNRLLAGG